MTFINEKITEEIIKQYDLENIIPRRWLRPLDHSWTIDKERNIWLYKAYDNDSAYMRDGLTPPPHVYWGFYWGGQIILAKVDMVNITEKEAELIKELKFQGKNVRMAPRTIVEIQIPPPLKDKQQEILNDMEEAFKAYGVIGFNPDVAPDNCSDKNIFFTFNVAL